jgi:hypothetical protein
MSLEFLEHYHSQTFKPAKVKTLTQAVKFVDERGFVFFWPIQDFTLPSLWVSVAGFRPVPNNQSDPAHVTWGWKDQMLGERKWFYAKVLRRKGTMIALELAPYFYALSQNYGEPESDYLNQFGEGKMTSEAKRVYEILLEDGPLHTQALRKKAGLRKDMYRFSKALDELQADFKVMPVKVVEAGRWGYAHQYECVHRHHPEFVEKAGRIGSLEARARILEEYFTSVGAATLGEVRKLFGWDLDDSLEALEQLMNKQKIVGRSEPKNDSVYVLKKLVPRD